MNRALTPSEEKELMALLGVTELEQIREALTLSSDSEEKTSSDSSGASSSESSRFPEDESSDESESSSESDAGLSDISTDSCPR